MKLFNDPEIEITRFSVEDVITASTWENPGVEEGEENQVS